MRRSTYYYHNRRFVGARPFWCCLGLLRLKQCRVLRSN